MVLATSLDVTQLHIPVLIASSVTVGQPRHSAHRVITLNPSGIEPLAAPDKSPDYDQRTCTAQGIGLLLPVALRWTSGEPSGSCGKHTVHSELRVRKEPV
jgi:hypothetical protein